MPHPIALPVLTFVAALGIALNLGGCASGETQPPPDYAAIVAQGDRSDADRTTDRRRDPVQLLAFTGVRPGMTVIDVGAGGGYSTELMARAVGPTGRVYAQDDAPMERARQAFDQRAATPVFANVVRVQRPYDDPVPPGVRNVDLVTFFFAYHDTVHNGVDHARMNRALYDALKPGGVLVVADHAAAPGAGASVTRSLHRIEEETVRSGLERSGFRYVGSAEFLRHPEDRRDVIVFKSPVPVDEFVMKFVKP